MSPYGPEGAIFIYQVTLVDTIINFLLYMYVNAANVVRLFTPFVNCYICSNTNIYYYRYMYVAVPTATIQVSVHLYKSPCSIKWIRQLTWYIFHMQHAMMYTLIGLGTVCPLARECSPRALARRLYIVQVDTPCSNRPTYFTWLYVVK